MNTHLPWIALSGQVKSEWNGRLHSLMSGGRGLEWTSRVDGIKLPKEEDARSSRATGGSKMQGTRTVVGVDIAKRVFQLHWVDLETGELKGPPADALEVSGALRQSRAVPGRHGGLRRRAALGAPAAGAGPRGPAAAGEDGPPVRQRQQG